MSITVSIILDRKRESKKGYPVKLRVTSNRVSEYISLRMYFSIDEFERITTLKRLNTNERYFKAEFQRVEVKALKIIRSMNEYSFQSFKELYSGKKVQSNKIDTSIGVLIEERVKAFKDADKYQSAGVYSSLKSSLNIFKAGIKIDKIDSKFLHSYHKYLLDNGKSITTVSIYMRSFRAVINANKNLIKEYPFNEYKIPKANNNKRAINENDLKRILNYSFDNDIDNLYLDLFKFSFYCGGANTVDLSTFKHSNIEDGVLTFIRSKTGSKVSIHLLNEALAIIKKYKDIDSEYIFPLVVSEDKRYLHERVKNIVRRINKRLAKVCIGLDIQKINSYSARHSFATIMQGKNISIAFISKALGHSSIKTTEIYLGDFSQEQMRDNMQALI